jgi:transposase-like protein
MTNNGRIRRVHSADFKTKVVLDLLKEVDTVQKISSKYGIHVTQAKRWREIAEGVLQNAFAGKPPDIIAAEKDKRIEELTMLIGQKEIELDFVKKKVGLFNH